MSAASERDVEALALVIQGGDPRVRINPLSAATEVLRSDWYAQRIAAARVEGASAELEELLTEIRRLRMGNHPAGRALPHLALAEALTERDAEHEGGEGA